MNRRREDGLTWQECAEAGMCKAEAARAMGVQAPAATHAAKRHGLTFSVGLRGKPGDRPQQSDKMRERFANREWKVSWLERLGVKLWTEAQDNVLRENWKSKTDAQIGEMLGRTAKGIANRRWLLKLLADPSQNAKKTRRRTGLGKGVRLISPHLVPDPPQGITKAQRLFARVNPDHPEARMLRAFMGEDMRA